METDTPYSGWSWLNPGMRVRRFIPRRDSSDEKAPLTPQWALDSITNKCLKNRLSPLLMYTYNGASSHTLDGELEIFLLLRRHFTNGSVILRFVSSLYLICGSKMFLFSSLKGCCGLAHAAIRVWPQFVGATAMPTWKEHTLISAECI